MLQSHKKCGVDVKKYTVKSEPITALRGHSCSWTSHEQGRLVFVSWNANTRWSHHQLPVCAGRESLSTGRALRILGWNLHSKEKISTLLQTSTRKKKTYWYESMSSWKSLFTSSWFFYFSISGPSNVEIMLLDFLNIQRSNCNRSYSVWTWTAFTWTV